MMIEMVSTVEKSAIYALSFYWICGKPIQVALYFIPLSKSLYRHLSFQYISIIPLIHSYAGKSGITPS